MFNNIGSKIKSVAKVFFIFEVIACIIAAIVLFVGEASGYGLLILICGPIVAWISSLTTYGFGVLVEKICSIEQALKAPEQSPEKEERIKKVQELFYKNQITAEEYRKALERIND